MHHTISNALIRSSFQKRRKQVISLAKSGWIVFRMGLKFVEAIHYSQCMKIRLSISIKNQPIETVRRRNLDEINTSRIWVRTFELSLSFETTKQTHQSENSKTAKGKSLQTRSDKDQAITIPLQQLSKPKPSRKSSGWPSNWAPRWDGNSIWITRLLTLGRTSQHYLHHPSSISIILTPGCIIPLLVVAPTPDIACVNLHHFARPQRTALLIVPRAGIERL